MLLFVSLQGTFIFSLVQYKPLKFNKTYLYPDWAYALGWFLGLACVALVPLWMIWKVYRSKLTVWQVRLLSMVVVDTMVRYNFHENTKVARKCHLPVPTAYIAW